MSAYLWLILKWKDVTSEILAKHFISQLLFAKVSVTLAMITWKANV